jgi:hypothetical protein
MSNKIFKKKEVLKLIKEDMIPYGDDPNRIERSIERRITNRQNPLGANPAFPEGTPESNFEEIMASEQFKNSIEKIKTYAGRKNIRVVDGRGVIQPMALVQLQMELVRDMVNKERNHKPQLEKLAIKLLKQDFNIPGQLQSKIENGRTIYYDGSLQYDVSLTLPVDLSDAQTEMQMQMQQEPEEVIENIEELDLEVAKRRFLNAMMAGAAFKGQYMFHMAEDEINFIDEDLITEYGLLMAITEWAYFMIPPEHAAAAAASGEQAGGSERVDFTTEPPTLICRARSFPLLCHEIVKSFMEFMSAWGLPQGGEESEVKKAQHILNKADFLEAENWDLMLGPGFWARFLDAIDENEIDIKSNLYTKIVQMPVKEFNSFMKEVLKKSPRGKQMMVDLANEIKDAISKEEYNTAMIPYSEPEEEPNNEPNNEPDEDIDVDDIDISDLFK